MKTHTPLFCLAVIISGCRRSHKDASWRQAHFIVPKTSDSVGRSGLGGAENNSRSQSRHANAEMIVQVGYIDDRFGPLGLAAVVVLALTAIFIISIADLVLQLRVNSRP